MRRIVVLAFVVLLTLVVSLPAWAANATLTADLSWENEVPPAIDTSATGSAEFRLSHGQSQICFHIETTDLSGDILAAHIHEGAAGVNGGVVVNLGAVTRGCVDVDIAVLKDIRANPGDYYLNVHTALNPGGEVRGQLSD